MVTTTHGPAIQTSGGGGTRRGFTAVLAAAIALAWLAVVFGPDGMEMGLLAFVAAWTVMMAAMMLPSAAPLVLLYRLGASTYGTTLLIAGYVAVWGAAGLPAYLAHELVPMSVSPLILAVAGLYQFTPFKSSCLRQCRTPADFLVQRWGRGPFRLGVEHGLWCLGCCWALMAVLVLVGMMGLAWVVALAGIVAVEKISRHGILFSRLTGAAFLAAAIYQGIR
jgi:predicted metal-binding membrane protein